MAEGIPSPEQLHGLLWKVVKGGARAPDLVRNKDEGGRDFVDAVYPEHGDPPPDLSVRAIETEERLRQCLATKLEDSEATFFQHVYALDVTGTKPPSATSRWAEAARVRYGYSKLNQQSRRRSWKDKHIWDLAFKLHEWLREQHDPQRRTE